MNRYVIFIFYARVSRAKVEYNRQYIRSYTFYRVRVILLEMSKSVKSSGKNSRGITDAKNASD